MIALFASLIFVAIFIIPTFIMVIVARSSGLRIAPISGLSITKEVITFSLFYLPVYALLCWWPFDYNVFKPVLDLIELDLILKNSGDFIAVDVRDLLTNNIQTWLAFLSVYYFLTGSLCYGILRLCWMSKILRTMVEYVAVGFGLLDEIPLRIDQAKREYQDALVDVFDKSANRLYVGTIHAYISSGTQGIILKDVRSMTTFNESNSHDNGDSTSQEKYFRESGQYKLEELIILKENIGNINIQGSTKVFDVVIKDVVNDLES